jgi:hypothetical protein
MCEYLHLGRHSQSPISQWKVSESFGKAEVLHRLRRLKIGPTTSMVLTERPVWRNAPG